MSDTLKIESNSFFRTFLSEISPKSTLFNLYAKNKSMMKYKMNLKDKLPKVNLKRIGINVRNNMRNKKNDKTFIIDNLSKKSFNLIMLIIPFLKIGSILNF